ncbi:hypothetical protein V8C44DRAFT_204950 [Trichoderma aethiopicum]
MPVPGFHAGPWLQAPDITGRALHASTCGYVINELAPLQTSPERMKEGMRIVFQTPGGVFCSPPADGGVSPLPVSHSRGRLEQRRRGRRLGFLCCPATKPGCTEEALVLVGAPASLARLLLLASRPLPRTGIEAKRAWQETIIFWRRVPRFSQWANSMRCDNGATNSRWGIAPGSSQAVRFPSFCKRLRAAVREKQDENFGRRKKRIRRKDRPASTL